MAIEIFFPYARIFRIPVFGATLKQSKNAGFDGVECHFIGDLLHEKNVIDVREEAYELDLKLRFHQGWSWRSGQRIWQNAVLRPLGALVPIDQPYAEQTRFAHNDPVVMYGNVAHTVQQPNYIFQTTSEFEDGKKYVSSISDFIPIMTEDKLPVVFDTQHILEWNFNTPSVAGLPDNPKELGNTLCALWRIMSPYAKEIHFCDCVPTLGSAQGRNVYPGTGVLPLQEFAAEVRQSGWNGIITPEVAPQHVRKDKILGSLSDMIRSIF